MIVLNMKHIMVYNKKKVSIELLCEKKILLEYLAIMRLSSP